MQSQIHIQLYRLAVTIQSIEVLLELDSGVGLMLSFRKAITLLTT